MELINDKCAEHNKNRPENNCSQNPPKENFMMVLFLKFKKTEHKHDNKKIVY